MQGCFSDEPSARATKTTFLSPGPRHHHLHRQGVFGTYPNEEALGMGVERGFHLGVRSVQSTKKSPRTEKHHHEPLTLPGFDEPPPPFIATLDEVSGRKRG